MSETMQENESNLPISDGSCHVSSSNYENILSTLTQNPSNFNSISIKNLPIDKVKTFVATFGSEAKEFDWTLNEDLTSTDLIEVLNLMPSIEKLSIGLKYKIIVKVEESEKLLDNSKKLKVNDGLKLPKLVTLHVKIESSEQASIYDFFTKFLPQNQLVEHKISEVPHKISHSHYSPSLFQSVENFIKSQKSIKKLIAMEAELLDCVEFLDLDELTIGKEVEMCIEILSAFKCQHNLKVLKCARGFSYEEEDVYNLFDEIHKMKELEVLEMRFGTGVTLELLQDLKNLRSLRSEKSYYFHIKFGESQKWIGSKFENLVELIVPENEINNPELLEAFPNLKILTVKSSLKLNLFAKFLSKLEALKVEYYTRKFDEIYELDTEVVHESLKTLRITARVHNFWKFSANISELFEMFPNLEIFDFEVRKFITKFEVETPDPKFFANFLNFQNLKRLKVTKIPIRFCTEVAEDLVKLSRKLDKVELKFEDKIEINDKWENFTYRNLIQSIKSEYKVKWNKKREMPRDNWMKSETFETDHEESNNKRCYKKFQLRIESRDEGEVDAEENIESDEHSETEDFWNYLNDQNGSEEENE